MSESMKVVTIGGGFGGFLRLNGDPPTDFNFTKELSEVRAAREIKPESVNVPSESRPAARGRS
jgi:hypothetical protein